MKLLTLLLFVGCVKSGDETKRRLEKLDTFCLTTRMAIREDRLALEGSDPLKRDAAYERFYESRVIHHNVDSLLMCVDEVPTLPTACYLNKNWGCLAELARDIEGKMVP